jgi:hypothetical protein
VAAKLPFYAWSSNIWGYNARAWGGSSKRNKGSPVELKVFREADGLQFFFMSSFQRGQPRCCPLFKTCNERNKYYWVQRAQGEGMGVGDGGQAMREND